MMQFSGYGVDITFSGSLSDWRQFLPSVQILLDWKWWPAITNVRKLAGNLVYRHAQMKKLIWPPVQNVKFTLKIAGFNQFYCYFVDLNHR